MKNFGQVIVNPTTGVVTILTSIANAALNFYDAIKTGKIQKKFQQRLDSDQQKMDYVKAIADRYKSIGIKASAVTAYVPGTQEFENLLKKSLINDMDYKGWCNADIYQPMGPNDSSGKPRQILATISRTGLVTNNIASIPPDAGIVWANNCKIADDEFRMTSINKVKEGKKATFYKAILEDINLRDIALRVGTGVLIAVVLLLLVKTQKSLLVEQETVLKKKKPIRPGQAV